MLPIRGIRRSCAVSSLVPRPVMRTLIPLLLMLAAAVEAQSASWPLPTTPPARPRLLFQATGLSAVQQRIAVPGSRAAQAFAQLSTSSAFQCGTSNGLCPGGSQESWRVYRTLRFMTEQAFRWRVAGDAAAGASAKGLLVSGAWNCLNALTPTGQNGYVNGTYPAAMGITYDLIHPLLSASERTQVVAKLEQWITALQLGSSGAGPLSAYGGATDNHSFGLASGIVVALLAIWGDSQLASIPASISARLDFIRDGYLDAISPDGSIDESFGYACYGAEYALHAMLAGWYAGFGDRIAGTNILKTPRFYGMALCGDAPPWMGDSSPSHRGLRFDPVLYHAVSRTGDTIGLHALLAWEQKQPITVDASTFAYSPWISLILHYPENLLPEAPLVTSALFRDNLNLPSATLGAGWNKTHNNAAPGNGALAFLHSARAGLEAFDVSYMIRDEWMNHAHEDDGHLTFGVGGKIHFMDRGYAQNGGAFLDAQHSDHNIVTVQGAGAFASANHFAPPGTDGRFGGVVKARLVSRQSGVDHVRGDHAGMWMLSRAQRSVLLVKDESAPFLVVMDDVATGGTGSVIFEERWNAAGPWSGQGTFSSPALMNVGGVNMRSFWLGDPVTLAPGAATLTAASALTCWPHIVRAGSASGERTFMSVHAAAVATQFTPPVQAIAGVSGGSFDIGGRRHKILGARSGVSAGDQSDQSDGSMLWVRRIGNFISGYALLEGSMLVSQGTQLVNSNLPISVSVMDGHVSVERQGASPSALLATLFIPWGWPVSSLSVDGQFAQFHQVGTTLVIGGQAGTPAPWGNSDRFYSFTEGVLSDALPSANLVLTSDGRVSAASGTASLDLRGGQAFHAVPVWVGCDVQATGALGSLAGTVMIGTSLGASNQLLLELRRASGGIAAVLSAPGIPQSTVLIPGTGELRAALNWYPVNGHMALYDRLGNLLAEYSTSAVTSQPCRVRCTVTSAGILDDVSFYEGTGTNARATGLCVWLTPLGRLGWSVSASNYLGGLGYSLEINGWTIPPELLTSLMSAAQFHELIATTGSGMPPAGLEEVAYESSSAIVPLLMGQPYNVSFVTAAGELLAAGTWYGL